MTQEVTYTVRVYIKLIKSSKECHFFVVHVYKYIPVSHGCLHFFTRRLVSRLGKGKNHLLAPLISHLPLSLSIGIADAERIIVKRHSDERRSLGLPRTRIASILLCFSQPVVLYCFFADYQSKIVSSTLYLSQLLL